MISVASRVIFIAVILLLTASLAAGQLFHSRQDWPILGSPIGLGIADLNGDGLDDIVAGNYNYDSLSILHGDGSGGFLPVVNYQSLSYAEDLKTADIDNDNDIDIVVATYSEMAAVRNNGDGTFAVPEYITVDSYLGDFMLADVNHDNYQDIIVANNEYLFDSVSVLLNNGDGTFADAVNFQVAENTYGVTAADLNGDTHLDLAVACYMIDSMAILFGDGSGGFGAAVKYEVGDRPLKIRASDYDNDTDPDLLVMDRNGVMVMANDGSGGFTAAGSHAGQSSPDNIAVADFNGDTFEDFVISGDSVEVFLNNGSGSFDSPYAYWVGEYPEFLAVGQLDDDASVDIAVLPYEDDDPGFVAVLLNDGTGDFMTAATLDAIAQDNALCASDIDGDNDWDLIVVSWWLGSTDTLVVMQNDGTGVFTPGVKYPVGQKAWTVVASDLTGDNMDDFIVGYSDLGTNYVTVLLNNGSGFLGGATNYTVQLRPTAIFADDFDGDDFNDLAVLNIRDTSVSILINDGDGTFGTATNYNVGSATDISGGLFNNDSYPDLVVAKYGQGVVRLLMNDGDGTFTVGDDHPIGDYPQVVEVDDLDGDGDDDIFTANYGNNVSILENDNFTTFLSEIKHSVGVEPENILSGDFNGDGIKDIVTINGGSYNLSILPGNGNLVFDSALFFGIPGSDPEDFCAADFDDDNDLDIALANYNNDNIALFFNRTDILSDVVDDRDNQLLPTESRLAQNYPNPFNPSTTIEYVTTSRGPVEISVYNLLGRKVATLVEGIIPAGEHSATWDGCDSRGRSVATGLYFYEIRTADFVESRKMLLLK